MFVYRLPMISIHALLAESDAGKPGRCRTAGISIHALLAESDHCMSRCTVAGSCHFYPRSPCGERLSPILILGLLPRFLSTLSLRRATPKNTPPHTPKAAISIHALLAESDAAPQQENGQAATISIHALLAESDPAGAGCPAQIQHFYPRSPCGERLGTLRTVSVRKIFLSTLSLRRATHYDNYNLHCVEISIHALLAESDCVSWTAPSLLLRFLSTLSLRRATTPDIPKEQKQNISIHALLAESDVKLFRQNYDCFISIHALLAESDKIIPGAQRQPPISIHALLAESDTSLVVIGTNCIISIHALLAESDVINNVINGINKIFLSTLSLRRATKLKTPCVKLSIISIHALLAESD